jgi:hypothetical protein
LKGITARRPNPMAEFTSGGTTGVARITEAGTTGASKVALKDGSSLSGTLMTPQGPITWTRTSEGSIVAEGGGQKLTASGHNESDGSWQQRVVYARTGKSPYLTIESVGNVAEHTIEVTFSDGSSRLTLQVANIDALVTSGTATLSGTFKGAAVHWTGHVDLTSNPFVGQPIGGWPTGAFAAEFREAAFFPPLGKAISQKLSLVPASPSGVGLPQAGGPLKIQPLTFEGFLGRALAWTIGGGIGVAVATAVTAATENPELGAQVGAEVGGAVASGLNDLVTAVDDKDAPVDSLPVPSVFDVPPLDPEPTTGKSSSASQDDPPPPGPVTSPTDPQIGEGDDGSGGGSGHKILDDPSGPKLQDD